jgi:hypothetical protein
MTMNTEHVQGETVNPVGILIQRGFYQVLYLVKCVQHISIDVRFALWRSILS